MDRFLVGNVKNNSSDKFIDVGLSSATVLFYQNFMSSDDANKFYDVFEKLKYWEKKDIKIAGKICKQNRFSCHFASDPNLHFRYSGTNNTGHIFTKELLDIKDRIEKLLQNKWKFNYCLLNYYPDGSSNIGMHSDDERDLDGPIASVSLGVSRYFDFHPIESIFTKENNVVPGKKRIQLTNGSMVLMMPNTQKYWKHGIPIESKIDKGRINLTFRVVKNNHGDNKL
uniref:Fe2OG dioxygenase domain-containing protein n=1 Tax=viral metagenome TaxID=1070528 RepID=A0A6C0E8W1_9ZZZZ